LSDIGFFVVDLGFEFSKPLFLIAFLVLELLFPVLQFFFLFPEFVDFLCDAFETAFIQFSGAVD